MIDRLVRVVAHADELRCIALPGLRDGVDRERWLDGAVATARRVVDHWGGIDDSFLRATIEHALAQRTDADVLALQLWPDDAMLTGLVRVSVHDAEGAPAVAHRLEQSGAARIDRIDGAMGAGCEWLHVGPLPGEEEASLVGWQALFAGESVDVLVSLEPTVPQLLPVLLDDARALAQDVAVWVDGEPVRAVDVASLLGIGYGEAWSTEARA